MACAASQANVTSSPAVRLDATAESDVHLGATDFPQRFGQHFLARNKHATVSIWVGGNSGVTSSTGFEVKPLETFVCDLQSGDQVWAVAGSGTVTCDVFQAGV